MQAILDKLKDNLQIIYRKGVDADNQLDQLQQAGKGKHQSVFDKSAGFNVNSKRFLPYVQELAEDIQQLEQNTDELDEKALALVVKKIEVLLTTLASFSASLKG